MPEYRVTYYVPADKQLQLNPFTICADGIVEAAVLAYVQVEKSSNKEFLVKSIELVENGRMSKKDKLGGKDGA